MRAGMGVFWLAILAIAAPAAATPVATTEQERALYGRVWPRSVAATGASSCGCRELRRFRTCG
jgi:hypothetical protein